MPEPRLEGPRIVACISQRVAAAVPQHVGVHLGIPARAPMRLISRLTASAVNGPPRSVAKTYPLSALSPHSLKSQGLQVTDWQTCVVMDHGNPHNFCGSGKPLRSTPIGVRHSRYEGAATGNAWTTGIIAGESRMA